MGGGTYLCGQKLRTCVGLGLQEKEMGKMTYDREIRQENNELS